MKIIDEKQLRVIAKGVGPVIRDYTAPLHARIAALEARPAVVYRGIWRNDQQYAEASLVTDGGSLWIAKAESRGARPGSDATSWQLIVKRGEAR
jgi:hypothetical protein